MLPAYHTGISGAGALKNLRRLHGKQKLQFLWDYYKFPLAVLCIAVSVAAYSIYGHMTQKNTILYTALINVTAGEELRQNLTDAFLKSIDIDSSKNNCQLYTGLYLTEDMNSAYHAYTYASRMKILAAIDARQMDVALMDQEAFDAFSQNGYLYEMDCFFSEHTPLFETLKPYFAENTVILKDNSLDLYFDETAIYDAETETHVMGIDLSGSPVIQKAGFRDTVYLGFLKNTLHKDAVIEFLQYLYS